MAAAPDIKTPAARGAITKETRDATFAARSLDQLPVVRTVRRVVIRARAAWRDAAGDGGDAGVAWVASKLRAASRGARRTTGTCEHPAGGPCRIAGGRFRRAVYHGLSGARRHSSRCTEPDRCYRR